MASPVFDTRAVFLVVFVLARNLLGAANFHAVIAFWMSPFIVEAILMAACGCSAQTEADYGDWQRFWALVDGIGV